jgi:hypothetical protein
MASTIVEREVSPQKARVRIRKYRAIAPPVRMTLLQLKTRLGKEGCAGETLKAATVTK